MMERILNNKWLKVGLLAVIGLLLAGGLVLAGYKLGQRQVLLKIPQLGVVPTQITTLTPTPPLDETATWKTYRNEKYGFEFRYPQNFQTTESLGQYFLNQKPVIELENEIFNYLNNQINAYLTISVKPNAKSECEYIPRGNIDSLQNKVIDGITFTMFSSTGVATGNTYSNTIFHYLKDTTCYEIVTTIHEASDGSTPEALPKINEQKSRLISQLDLILSTFKFLD